MSLLIKYQNVWIGEGLAEVSIVGLDPDEEHVGIKVLGGKDFVGSVKTKDPVGIAEGVRVKVVVNTI